MPQAAKAEVEAEVLAYIGLGSNLHDPKRQVLSAREALAAQPAIREVAFSSLYRSAPMGPKDQPDYINAVMALSTTLDALALLDRLQAIENQHGRERLERWGARTLDLDLLVYGEAILSHPRLSVPHVGIEHREFVLYPLAEIAPDLVVPGLGPVQQLVSICPRKGLEVVSHDESR